jgi:hypothetical protein
LRNRMLVFTLDLEPKSNPWIWNGVAGVNLLVSRGGLNHRL